MNEKEKLDCILENHLMDIKNHIHSIDVIISKIYGLNAEKEKTEIIDDKKVTYSEPDNMWFDYPKEKPKGQPNCLFDVYRKKSGEMRRRCRWHSSLKQFYYLLSWEKVFIYNDDVESWRYMLDDLTRERILMSEEEVEELFRENVENSINSSIIKEWESPEENEAWNYFKKESKNE